MATVESFGYAEFEDLTPVEAGDGGEDLVLPSGRRVRVRGMSRYELVLNGKGTDDNTVIEIRNLHTTLLQPKLTRGQAEAFYRNRAAAADVVAILGRVRELSGLAEGAEKSEVSEVRDEA